MKYTNGTDYVEAMQWKGETSKHELMIFTNEDFLGMMKSETETKVFVDGIDGESLIVCEGDYIIKESEDEFSKLSESEFNEKYSGFNTIITTI